MNLQWALRGVVARLLPLPPEQRAAAAWDEAAAICEEDVATNEALGEHGLGVIRAIWDAKFRLERPVRNAAGEIIDGHQLEPRARLEAIMRWSAIPGASRHHWGTDCDVYDRAAVGEAGLQLVPAEYAAGGHQARLHDWLQQHMHRFGFYQPYRTDRGGVCPEPWHLSYAPLAMECERALDRDGLLDLLRETAADASLRIEGHELLCTHLDEWYARFVVAVDAPPVDVVLTR